MVLVGGRGRGRGADGGGGRRRVQRRRGRVEEPPLALGRRLQPPVSRLDALLLQGDGARHLQLKEIKIRGDFSDFVKNWSSEQSEPSRAAIFVISVFSPLPALSLSPSVSNEPT